MDIDILFFKLWRNIVINRIIFKYAALYKKNSNIECDDFNLLREYIQRDYITTLVYVNKRDYYNLNNRYTVKDESILSKGDLPEFGALRIVDFQRGAFIKSGDVFPNGVEIINFGHSNNTIQLSELPISVHTITNVLLKKPYSDNQIPENITSLSFHKTMNSREFYKDIIIGSSVVKLKLHCFQMVPPTFIPSSITDLTIDYDEDFGKFESNQQSVIPSTVIKLKLNIEGECTIEKGLIPMGVKELYIHCQDNDGCKKKFNKYSLPNSITKLYFRSIHSNLQIQDIFPVNIIPSSVKELHFDIHRYPLSISFKNIFPISLVKLIINTEKSIVDPTFTPLLSTLPLIKYLKIDNKIIDLTNKH